MRIGIISTMGGGPWGGSEDLWAQMAHRALERNHDVSVCLLRPWSDHSKWRALERAGAAVFSEPAETSGIARAAERLGRLSYRLGSVLRQRISPLRQLLAARPEIILVSNGGVTPTQKVIQALSGPYSFIPYVTLCHASYTFFPSVLARQQLLQFYQGARYALFVAEAGVRDIERALATRLSNARVVRNPVNLGSLDPIEWPNSEAVRLACVARLSAATKGQDILLEVLGRRHWRERDYHLSLYGAGPDETYLRDLSVYHGVSDRVSFVGQTDDVRRIWQENHALVMPSRLEGMPLAAVEAMICARPVIATAVAGIPEWVHDERSGFLAAAPTPELFDQALERAWTRRTEWEAIGRNGRNDALRLYDPMPGDTLLSILTDASRSERKVPRTSENDFREPRGGL